MTKYQSEIEHVVDRLIERGFRDECMVKNCDRNGDPVELLPLDPIDHDSTQIVACEHHMEWAERRNKLAKQVTNELRNAREEIGEEYLEEIQALADPNGALTEDVLMGEFDSVEAAARSGEKYE